MAHLYRKFNNITHRLKVVVRDIFINDFLGLCIIPEEIRRVLYRLFGMKIDRARIRPNCFFEGHSLHKIKIGNGVFINYRCTFSCNEDLIIEDNCTIGMEVSFCTSTHKLGNQKQRAGESIGLPIYIGSGTWIGTRAIILPGVTIGSGCIIAAGAIISKDCEPNGLYGGIPAKKIKDLPVVGKRQSSKGGLVL